MRSASSWVSAHAGLEAVAPPAFFLPPLFLTFFFPGLAFGATPVALLSCCGAAPEGEEEEAAPLEGEVASTGSVLLVLEGFRAAQKRARDT